MYLTREHVMPRGDKSSYTSKQKRQARHIEEGYEKRGVPEKEAARRAWATVNEETGGGKKSGSGRGKKVNRAPSRKGGKRGGKAPLRSRPRPRNRPRLARRRRHGSAGQGEGAGSVLARVIWVSKDIQVITPALSKYPTCPASHPPWPRFTAPRPRAGNADAAGRAPGAAPAIATRQARTSPECLCPF
jgi:plasmid stabilization system protein ParE